MGCPAGNRSTFATTPCIGSYTIRKAGRPGSAANYAIYHGNYCSDRYSPFAEYRINGQYSCFDCTISPYSDFGSDAESYVQILVDDVVRYTTPLIKARSGVYHAHVDLRGAEYMKIVIHKGEHGCLIISDALLGA